MVINYKRLNDNIQVDSYDIPSKEQLINSIQEATIFSKFDCKLGFWRIMLDDSSKSWTAFTCPQGCYEWIVMPFGLKTAPNIFQRKMDSIFKKHHSFVLVYIDDILVFSRTQEEHYKHLRIVFQLFIENGLIISKKKMELCKEIISKKKMELCKEYIEYLGVRIGKGKIQLQPHIAQKILEFPDKIEDKKKLQSFLGTLNYARPFIKDLSKIVGPLYSKTTPNGQKYFNQQDIELVKKIKEICKSLPELELPLESDYIVIEVDASEKGW